MSIKSLLLLETSLCTLPIQCPDFETNLLAVCVCTISFDFQRSNIVA